MKWIDEDTQPLGPFDGILVIMNIGEDAENDSECMQAIKQAYDKAICQGWVVIHVFERGVEPPPWFLGQIEGHNVLCLPQKVGRNDLDFPLLPEPREKEFLKIKRAICADEEVAFSTRKPRFQIAGHCRIEGSEVLFPPTEP